MKSIRRENGITKECRVTLHRVNLDEYKQEGTTKPDESINTKESATCLIEDVCVSVVKSKKVEEQPKLNTIGKNKEKNTTKPDKSINMKKSATCLKEDECVTVAKLKEIEEQREVNTVEKDKEEKSATRSMTRSMSRSMKDPKVNTENQHKKSDEGINKKEQQNKKRRIEEKEEGTLVQLAIGKKQPARKNNRKAVSSILSLKPALQQFEMVWAHIKGFSNWPGIIEEETPKGRYRIHFFGDYTRSDVTKNKIMHLLEGFNFYATMKKPTSLLCKAIAEAQLFILDQNRRECPICKMIKIKSQMRLEN